MASNFNITAMSDALKVQYPAASKNDLITKIGPLLADIPKDTSMVGDFTAIAMRIDTAQTRSASITQAKTNSTTSSAIPLIKTFQISPVLNHAWATVDQETILKTRNQEGSYWNALKLAAEDSMIMLGADQAYSLYRSGYGRIGVIDATTSLSSAVIQLTNLGDTVAWHAGLQVVFSATESADLLRNSGGALTVTSVDRSTGKVTFSANINTLNAVALGDSIFVLGDRDNSVTPARLKISGLEAYGPSTPVAANDNFNGVNRSADSRMQFCRITDGNLSDPLSALRRAAMLVASQGKGVSTKLDKFYVSFKIFDQVAAQMAGQYLRDPDKANQKTGVSSIWITTPVGLTEVVADQYCQDNTGWGLKLDTLKFHSQGDLVDLFDEDGLSSIRTDANGIEIRYFSYSNVSCNLPGANVRVDFS